MRLLLSIVLGCACAACGGSFPTIPLPSGGSVTVVDGGATVCVTVPLAVMLDGGTTGR